MLLCTSMKFLMPQSNFFVIFVSTSVRWGHTDNVPSLWADHWPSTAPFTKSFLLPVRWHSDSSVCHQRPSQNLPLVLFLASVPDTPPSCICCLIVWKCFPNPRILRYHVLASRIPKCPGVSLLLISPMDFYLHFRSQLKCYLFWEDLPQPPSGHDIALLPDFSYSSWLFQMMLFLGCWLAVPHFSLDCEAWRRGMSLLHVLFVYNNRRVVTD